MKLASLKHGRDGMLVVVSRDLARYVAVPHIAHTLQQAMDDWAHTAPRLMRVYDLMNEGPVAGEKVFHPQECASPLPRAYQWADGSAYVTHVELVRKARGAEMPASFWTDPLMYQGGSDNFIGPMDPILAADEAWGIDFEAEVAVITDDVPMGVSAADAEKHIKLLMLVNDVSLRNLIPNELAKNFGFFQSKPASAFSPVAITPDELSEAWSGGKAHLPLRVWLNGARFGEPNAGEDMTFSFPQLVAHAAKTRALVAGSIVGSGTVANKDHSRGSACLAERRTLEQIEQGAPKTPFMKFGDRVKIEMLDQQGKSLFGAIEQQVQRYGDDLTLYTYFRSSAAFRVRIALNLKGIKPTNQFVHLVKEGGQQFAESYKHLNPQALVPTLVDGDHTLQQSLAIIEFLDESYMDPPLLPSDKYSRARVRALAYAIACDIHPINNLRVRKYLLKEMHHNDAEVLEWQRHWMRIGFEAIETMLAGDKRTGKFCHGDTPSLADICLIPQMANARGAELDLSPYPTLKRIEKTAYELPAFLDALPKNQPDAE